MRDIGGASATLILSASFLNSLFTYNKLENTLVQSLYKLPKSELIRPWDKKDLVAEEQSSSHELY